MDVYDAATRRKVMKAVKSKNTKPEMAVRRMLHAAGFRYRLHQEGLPGRPDIVFTKPRKVIFVHGCFWHQHPNCVHADRPSSNQDYWRKKLDRNIARDASIQVELEANGWKTAVVWECQLRNPTLVLETLSDFLRDDAGNGNSADNLYATTKND